MNQIIHSQKLSDLVKDLLEDKTYDIVTDMPMLFDTNIYFDYSQIDMDTVFDLIEATAASAKPDHNFYFGAYEHIGEADLVVKTRWYIWAKDEDDAIAKVLERAEEYCEATGN